MKITGYIVRSTANMPCCQRRSHLRGGCEDFRPADIWWTAIHCAQHHHQQHKYWCVNISQSDCICAQRTFQASGPSTLIGNSFAATRVPTTVAQEPITKTSSSLPVSMNTRLGVHRHDLPFVVICRLACICRRNHTFTHSDQLYIRTHSPHVRCEEKQRDRQRQQKSVHDGILRRIAGNEAKVAEQEPSQRRDKGPAQPGHPNALTLLLHSGLSPCRPLQRTLQATLYSNMPPLTR